MKSLKNLNFEKIQNVGIRVDFNVPIDKNFKITDKTRLDRAKDTINFIKNKQCNILLLSHFGRPKEKFDDKYSFSKLIDQFQEILELKLNFISYANFLENGLDQFNFNRPNTTLLENIRFFDGEIKNDLSFSKSITDNLDLYVNEAFSASHRLHSSVNQMAKNILSTPGFNFEKEINAINDIKKSQKKKLAIIGGSKISTKINTLLSLTTSCSDIFIGGAMANNFLKYNKFNVSSSLIEEGAERMIEMIYSSAKQTGCEIHLPVDVMLDSDQSVLVNELDKNTEFKILDIADSSHIALENLVKKSDIILWNGPMGMIEDHKFSKGSVNLSHLLAKAQADVVIGGGDTILAINMAKEKFEDFYFVSTAGGAFLEALEDKELLGIEALKADL
ncbi:phosphoglycerate kinase [Alphaproteobacteria bacterium]|nr:phosphoglycerate kinase [Alphaproteobacteria bacterium]